MKVSVWKETGFFNHITFHLKLTTNILNCICSRIYPSVAIVLYIWCTGPSSWESVSLWWGTSATPLLHTYTFTGEGQLSANIQASLYSLWERQAALRRLLQEALIWLFFPNLAHSYRRPPLSFSGKIKSQQLFQDRRTMLGVGWRQGVRGCESVDSQIAPLKSAALTGLEGELDAARKGKHVLTEVRDLFQT